MLYSVCCCSVQIICVCVCLPANILVATYLLRRDPAERERIKEQVLELSKDDQVYERLTRALAPNIYEHDDVKKGILQLFGGANKNFKQSGKGRFR